MAAQAQGLPNELARAWKASGLPGASLSLVVQELGGQRMVAINANEPRNPASVMKLVTTWSALSELGRSEEHTSALQSLMRISYAVFCLKKTTRQTVNRTSCDTVNI